MMRSASRCDRIAAGKPYLQLESDGIVLVSGTGRRVAVVVDHGVAGIECGLDYVNVRFASGMVRRVHGAPVFRGNFVTRRRNGARVLYFPNDDLRAAVAVALGLDQLYDGVIFRCLQAENVEKTCVSLDWIAREDASATVVVERAKDLKLFDNNHRLELVVWGSGIDCVPCHMYMLCVNSFGDVFACCRQLKNLVIGNLQLTNIAKRVLGYIPEATCTCDKASLRTANAAERFRGPQSLTVELAGECNGNCSYCFQRPLSTYKRPFGYYAELESFIHDLHIRNVTFLGGEVSVQQKTIELMERLSNDGVKISIITNGAVPQAVERRLLAVSDDFLVTLNGFTQETVSLLSDLPFHRQLEFCLRAEALGKRLSVRFLVTPMTLHEIPAFLAWASQMRLEHLMLDVAVNTPEDYQATGVWGDSTLAGLDRKFWAPLLERVGEQSKAVLRCNAALMSEHGLSLLVCEEIVNLLGLGQDFMREIKADGRLEPKRTYISNKVWVKYWRSLEQVGGGH